MTAQQVFIKVITFSIFLFLGKSLSAQIVNIEDKRVFITDTTGWFGQVDLSFNLVKNAKLVTTMKGGARIDFVTGKHSAFSLTNYSFVKAGGEQFVNQGFQHFRYNYQLSKRSIGEFFTQVQYNERIRIRLRALFGTGLRFQFLEQKNKNAYAGLAYMYEYEDIADTTIIHRKHRMSSYLSFNFKTNSKISLSNTSYFQPVINDFSNFRLTTATSLLLQITERLFVKSSFSLTYDSQLSKEVSDIPETIYSFLNGLTWQF